MNDEKVLSNFIYAGARRSIDNELEQDPKRVTEDYIAQVFRQWLEISRIAPDTSSIKAKNEEELLSRLIEQYKCTEQYVRPQGFAYQDRAWRPWLNDRKGEIDWTYWNRYRDYLLAEKRWGRSTVHSMDVDTDKILDRMADPQQEGDFDRRGLVVASVQSGKTANYIGLIAKAADAGYRIIIVMAGIYNVLRNQTQERVEDGFIGYDLAGARKVGVGRGSDRQPVAVTSRVQDFSKNTERSLSGIKSRHVNEPLVFVVKKNVNSLREVTLWLRRNCKTSDSVLVIDDEADNASINVSYSKDDISRINGQIREILSLFPKSCYVGYTATPFANVLIDSKIHDDEKGNDIFPRSFIYTLEQSDAYFGAGKVFADIDESKPKHLRYIDEKLVKIKNGREVNYRSGDVLEFLPESLKRAMRVFVLACAMRILNGDKDEHMSMMVNISPYNSMQHSVHYLADEYLKELVDAIKSYASLSPRTALTTSDVLREMKEDWEYEYSDNGHSWDEVQMVLDRTIAPMHVVEINSQSSDALDYTHSIQRVIAVGGYRLSRGLTLEGLMVSYYARNARAYDSLMQMARWFGYRMGYEQYCRVWMSEQSAEWYAFVSDATEELIDEVRRMCSANSTPEEYGLCIRTHPDTLIVTARDKQGAGRQSEGGTVKFDGRAIQVTAFDRNPDELIYNELRAKELIGRIEKEGYAWERKNGILFRNVPSTLIRDYLSEYHNSEMPPGSAVGPVIRHLEKLNDIHCDQWFVYVASGSAASENEMFDVLDERIPRERRRPSIDTTKDSFVVTKRMLASRGVEKVMLSQDEVDEAERLASEFGGAKRNYSSADYLYVANNPILVLHPLTLGFSRGNAEAEYKEWSKKLKVGGDPRDVWYSSDYTESTVGWSIGFPRKDITAETGYMINDVAFRQWYVEDEEGEIDGEDAMPDE